MSKSIPASEFLQDFARYTDKATAERVVEVSSNGRPIGAFLSQSEYQHYLRLKARETRNLKIDDLPEEFAAALERGE